MIDFVVDMSRYFCHLSIWFCLLFENVKTEWFKSEQQNLNKMPKREWGKVLSLKCWMGGGGINSNLMSLGTFNAKSEIGDMVTMGPIKN